MTQLDDYQSALLATNAEISIAALVDALDNDDASFASFIIDHGLGPLWHERTNRDEFHASRLSAEALYLAQEKALSEIDAVLNGADIEYVLIKGAASRLLLYENPAIRACYDLDLLVNFNDRIRATSVLIAAGFTTKPISRNISHQLVLSRDVIDIDLHWSLLREGRLRNNCTADMIGRRRRSNGLWMLSAEDALFVLLVHPAFAKHLGGWGMGLHRVMDITNWLSTQSFDWQTVGARLAKEGVQTAAWATLRWVELLTSSQVPAGLEKMIADLRPGRLRSAWLDLWLRNDLSARISGAHWARLA